MSAPKLVPLLTVRDAARLLICGPVLPYGDEWAAPVLITLPRSTWLELDANRAALAEVPRG